MSNEDMQPEFSLPEEIRNLKRKYRGRGVLGRTFIRACLEHCVRYQRITCYFSSKGLLEWTETLPRLIRGELELIQVVFYQLNDPNDLEAIKQSHDPEAARRLREEKIQEVLDFAIFVEDSDKATTQRQKALAWLIANEKLELRYVTVTTEGDSRDLMHEKLGVFHFKEGLQVAFEGSANESYRAGYKNWERTKVYKS
jgi:hypothetical protein